MTNDELLEAWRRKLPNVEPTDRELSAFALGVEIGADALDAAERERDRLDAALRASCIDAREELREMGGGCSRAVAAEAERDALAADARRYRWLRDWMERRHLIRSEFCKPPDDAPVGDYVLIWTPYGTSKPIGWGLTADEAIDRAMRDDALDGAKGK